MISSISLSNTEEITCFKKKSAWALVRNLSFIAYNKENISQTQTL